MKRVSFPSLIHLLSRHTSNQLRIVQFLSHKSAVVSSISTAKKTSLQRCSRPHWSAPPYRPLQKLSCRRNPHLGSLVSRGTDEVTNGIFRARQTAPDDASLQRKTSGSEVAALQFPPGGSFNTSEFHHNPQDLVYNLLITAHSSHAQGQKLRRGANCLISLRSKFQFFYHLARFAKIPLGAL
jgi:hypothetical protein